MDNVNLSFSKARTEDFDVMSVLMKEAFDEDSRRHLGVEGGPPGYDNGEFVNKWYFHANGDAYTILADGKIVGAFVIFHNGKHKYFLGNIFIDPKCQDMGYGTRTWKYIESIYPDAVLFATETPVFSRRNHNFYVNKCGFKIVRIDNPKDETEASFYFEKEMK